MNFYENTNWVITGGTAGLGLALAKRLRSLGAKVAIVARGEERLFGIANDIGAIPIRGDVAQKDDTYRIAGQVFAQMDRVDYLVNNASSLGASPLKLLADTDCEELEAALNANLVGPFRLTKAILPAMLLKGRGTVVNITSDAAVNAYPTWGAYSASKAALEHLTRIWSEELKAQGLAFVTVDPGDMDTALHAEAVPDADRSQLKSPDDSAAKILNWLEERAKNPSQLSYERKSIWASLLSIMPLPLIGLISARIEQSFL